ncbi:MAG: hypothetical protein E6G97_04360 [Alphaproteobacteria bacterium]|nr:MAG: hypothetical protein E6G97_04360 [Alphaproteobacteria bacterium]
MNASKPAGQYYEAIGDTLEQAVERAHAQIPPRRERDFAVSRIIEWGMQRGGITGAQVFYVKLIEDETAPFKT